MPNILSIANRATARPAYLDLNEPISNARAETGQAMGGLRFAMQALKGNPIGAVVSDLMFPRPLGDGTLKGAVLRNDGYIGTGIDP